MKPDNTPKLPCRPGGQRFENVVKLRALERETRVNFPCPHCGEVVHSTTVRDYRARPSTEQTLARQAMNRHFAACPKVEHVDRQEATDRAD